MEVCSACCSMDNNWRSSDHRGFLCTDVQIIIHLFVYVTKLKMLGHKLMFSLSEGMT